MAVKFKKEKDLEKLFDTLALKEQQHENIFKRLHDRVGHELPENWGEISTYLRAIVESEFFLGKNKSLPSLEHLRSIDDAVSYATGFEKETLLFYQSMMEIIDDKEIMDKIINEERDHVIWLSDYKKTITDR